MQILIIEDSPKIRIALDVGLRKQGYIVQSTGSGEDGLRYCLTHDYDVIIVDILLPDLSGFELLKRIRKLKIDSGVIVVTARVDVEDRIKGLELGADDYVCKPFAFDELVSRIRAVIRRRAKLEEMVLQIENITINFTLKKIVVGESEIHLTSTEYKIIEYLALNRYKILSIGQILKKLNHHGEIPSRNSIEVHISTIRKKFKKHGVRDLLLTKRGMGFYLNNY